ncbi:Dolichyl-diphosphooligosaccharide--protein glycosyltransferase subunit 1A [Ranunculus cassubicifolius]
MAFRFVLLIILIIAYISSSVQSNLVISKIDRRIDLTSQIVRTLTNLKVENEGSNTVSEVLLCFPDYQAKNLAYLIVTTNEGKGKSKGSAINLTVEAVNPEGMPASLTFYSVSLPKPLSKGKTLTLDVFAIFTHSLQPFPEQITQADVQLVLFQDSAYYLSPYEVRGQSLSVRLPKARVESYTKLQNTKFVESEIRYGPYENLPAFSYSAVVVHYENNNPFGVVKELVREIEVSHWGNVQITEHYELVHGGAQSKGGFSRLDYQSRPHVRGVSSFNHLLARLPPRAHSVYYRDEIGNISTSHLRGDSRMTELEIAPRYPIFGGWKTSFTIGYGLPLKDFLFESEGKRFLNITFGCPMLELVIDHLIVKVVLPEGSSDMSISTPFPVKQSQEVKYSHLDIAGRPMMVLETINVVPEHNQHFQVYYKFSNLSLLREPLMLISGFLFLFLTCIIYVHTDMSISKSSPSYLAKLQWDEVLATLQQVQKIIHRCFGVHEKLEMSLRELSRTGDIQASKLARKTADSYLKELGKDLKPLLLFLQSCPQASQIWPKVEDLVGKEKEIEEKLMLKHVLVVDSREKKSGARETESKVALLQQKITALRHEVDELVEFLDEL